MSSTDAEPGSAAAPADPGGPAAEPGDPAAEPDGPAAEPDGPAAEPGDAQAAADAADAALQRRRRGLRQSAMDMVRSLAVVVAVVVALVLLVPRPNEIAQPAIDVGAAAGQASSRLGLSVAVPALPAGWTATSARVQTGTDGVLTWHVGYLTPSGQAAGMIQGARPTPDWEGTQVIDGAQRGSTVIDGRTWVLRSRPDRGITNYVLRQQGLTTIVTGRAPAADLTLLARSLDASLPG